MAKASEQFRQSDVAIWGVLALLLGAGAVFSANAMAFMPPGVLSALHGSRLDGASPEQLRQEVNGLASENQRMRTELASLTTRFGLVEQSSGEVTRRVGALEVSVPKLLEAIPAGAEIDRSNITASIGQDQVLTYDADGGSVAIRQQPMQVPTVPQTEATEIAQLPAIEPLEPTGPQADSRAYGVALGPTIQPAQAVAQWQDVSAKLGPLLFGLGPLVRDEANGVQKRLVAGPLESEAEAAALCQRVDRIGISCLPVPFTGVQMAGAP